MKRNFLILILVLFISKVSAQESRFSMAAYITVDQALQSYGDNVETNPSGLTIAGLYRIPNSKVSVGIDVGVAMYSNQRYVLDLSDMGYSESSAHIEEEDCYLSYNAFLRYSLKDFGPITPYGELRLGGSSFFSDKQYSKLSGPNAPETIEPEFDFHGTSFRAGIGGGVLINLGWLKKEPRRSLISIDLGVSANNGSNTTYRSLIESKNIPNRFEEGFYNTKTNSVLYRIGAVMRF